MRTLKKFIAMGCGMAAVSMVLLGCHGGGGPTSSSNLDMSDATYQVKKWDTNELWETWETSNGFLTRISEVICENGACRPGRSEYGTSKMGSMDSFKMPYANCIGVERDSADVYGKPAKDDYLICKSLKTITVDGCDGDNHAKKFPLEVGDLFVVQDLGSNNTLCGGWMYHAQKTG